MDMLKKRIRLIEPNNDDGRTVASQQKSTDINQLLKHYAKTGTFTHVSREIPTYGDFSNTTDYLAVQLQVKEVENLFMECSAKVRARFNHQPSEMLDFLADPANEQEAIDLGLAEGVPSPREPAVQDEPVASKPDTDKVEPESPIQGGE